MGLVLYENVLASWIRKWKILELSTFLGERGGGGGLITFATSWKENAGEPGFTEIASESSEWFLIKIIQVGEEQMDQLADSLVSSTWESNKQIARMSNCLYSATSDEGSCQILPSGFFPLTHFPLGVGPSHPSKKRILFNFALHILTGPYWIWYEKEIWNGS